MSITEISLKVGCQKCYFSIAIIFFSRCLPLRLSLSLSPIEFAIVLLEINFSVGNIEKFCTRHLYDCTVIDWFSALMFCIARRCVHPICIVCVVLAIANGRPQYPMQGNIIRICCQGFFVPMDEVTERRSGWCVIKLRSVIQKQFW